MRYAGIHELVPVDFEIVPRVKTERMGLGIEMHRCHSLPARASDQKFQYGAAHATPPPFRRDRHAPDMAIGQQATGRHRIAPPIQRQRMQAYRIGIIPFQCFGNLLFKDKNPVTNRLQCGHIITPRCGTHDEFTGRFHGGKL